MKYQIFLVAAMLSIGTPQAVNAQEFQCQVKKAVMQICQHLPPLDSIAGISMKADTSGKVWSVHLQFRNRKLLEANPKANKIIFKAFSQVRYKAVQPIKDRLGDLILRDGRVIYPVSLALRNIETWECPGDGE